jgi:hypothetical protein
MPHTYAIRLLPEDIEYLATIVSQEKVAKSYELDHLKIRASRDLRLAWKKVKGDLLNSFKDKPKEQKILSSIFQFGLVSALTEMYEELNSISPDPVKLRRKVDNVFFISSRYLQDIQKSDVKGGPEMPLVQGFLHDILCLMSVLIRRRGSRTD